MILINSLAIFLISVTFLSIISLILCIFHPESIFFSSIALTTGFYLFFRDSNFGEMPPIKWILCVFFVALIFRIEPFQWIMGGQDQGIYVNMSKHFQENNKILIDDEFLNGRNKIENNQEIKNIYQKSRIHKVNSIEQFQPGIYIYNSNQYNFQFYHAWPAWMATFGAVFGDNGRFYALTFFSLISILGLYLLTYELTQSEFFSLSLAFLISLNPLHTFFSKWPVTEIIVLAFSSLAFFYMARTYNYFNKNAVDISKNKLLFNISILLSSLLISCIFFIRISGFMYIPFFYILTLKSFFTSNSLNESYTTKYKYGFFLITFFYILSVWYGLVYCTPYPENIYETSFKPILGEEWFISIIYGISFLILLMMILLITPHNSSIKNTLKAFYIKTIPWVLPLIFLASAIIGFYKIYLLGYTDTYLNHWWFDQRWKLVNIGHPVWLHSSILLWCVYSSPFLVLILLMSWKKLLVNDLHKILLYFIVFFSIFTFSLQWSIPYQFYYSRYMLSESVPYTMVAGVVGGTLFKSVKLRWLFKGVLLLSIALFLALSLKQIGIVEGQIPKRTIEYLLKPINKGDLILFDRNENNWKPWIWNVLTPVQVYYQSSIFPYKSNEDLYKIIDWAILNKSWQIFIISPIKMNIKGIDEIIRAEYSDTIMERRNTIPTNAKKNSQEQSLYLYKINRKNYPVSIYDIEIISKKYPDILEKISGLSIYENWGRWSEGDKIILKFNYALPDQFSIHIKARAFGPNIGQPFSVKIGNEIKNFIINDQKVTEINLNFESPKNNLYDEILVTIPKPTSPASFDPTKKDNRLLGLGLLSLKVHQLKN